MLSYSYKDLRERYEKKELTVREVVTFYLERMQKYSDLNIYITECAQQALAAAEYSDKRFAENNPRPLEGMPMGIKDNCCTKGVLTTAASRMLAGFTPSYESTITEKLLEAGAIFLGKTNMDEFAMGSSNETSFFGPVLNPWDTSRVPGGSSGGSAASVAAGVALTAIGTDTGGSVRQPASFCGVTGMRPTYGRCSRYGLVAFASSLDQPGPIARNVVDNARVLQVIAGHDPKDMTTLSSDVPDYVRACSQATSLKGKRFALITEAVQGAQKDVQKNMQDMRQYITDLGGTVDEVSMPLQRYGVPVYLLVGACEASSNLARYDGMRYTHRSSEVKKSEDVFCLSRAEGFGEEVQRRLILGTFALSTGKYEEYYLRVQKIRRLMQNDCLDTLKKYDFLMTPTAPSEAFPLAFNPDPVFMYAQDVMTVQSALVGLPALSIPSGVGESGLPLGVQLTANFLEEDKIYAAAHVLEQAIGFESWLQK